MNKKYIKGIIITLAAALMVPVLTTQASAPGILKISTDYDYIEGLVIKGGNGGDDNAEGGPRHEVPIDADKKNDAELDIRFNENIGNVNVNIQQGNGVIYQNVVNSGSNSGLNIDISSMPAGTYKINFTDSEGVSYYADFVKRR